jgi:hypothetical protein
MQILALAVLLAVMQASPPVPRKTPDNSAQAPAQAESKSASGQTAPLPAPTPVKADSSGPAKSNDTEEHPEDAQHTVGISKLPPVTVMPSKRDWADWAYWGFNLLLVVVGGLQVLLLCRTLRAVRRQAGEMVRQRHEMAFQRQEIQLQRETMQSAERAWLVEKLNMTDDLPRRDDSGSIFFAALTIRNIGKQPAIIKAVHTRFHTSPGLPETPEYRLVDSEEKNTGRHGQLVVPREKLQIGSPLEELWLDDDKIHAIRKTYGLGLYIYGRIEYESVGVVAVNQFCYRWENMMGFHWTFDKEGFRKGGPPEYNCHTQYYKRPN